MTFHTEDPQISGAILQNLVTQVTWHLWVVCTSGFTKIHCLTKAEERFGREDCIFQGRKLIAILAVVQPQAGSGHTDLHGWAPWNMSHMGNPHYRSNTCYKILVLRVRWLGGGITILPCKTLFFKTPVSECHGHETGRTTIGWKNTLWLKWNTYPSLHYDMLWVHRMHFWQTPGNRQKNCWSQGSDWR